MVITVFFGRIVTFFDDEGKELELTEQEKSIFKILTTSVLSVSQNINQPLIRAMGWKK